ncbi:hypothetical protein BB560_001394 [Smittium megazygosporum]|uniref:RNA helicase n=1 Tax=Smittium megazygosporum TaxID=133381 RepID=A0A2T9ZHP7_9FUNG|nr:hypothetical protein BB560_001394 [Smittium megazygosporum]
MLHQLRAKTILSRILLKQNTFGSIQNFSYRGSLLRFPIPLSSSCIRHNTYSTFTDHATQFSELFVGTEINPQLIKNLQKINWKSPTEIQKTLIPIALQNKNVIASAGTGQGKTGAYLLPLIHKIQQEKSRINKKHISSLNSSYPTAIILVPTSQLAYQVTSVANTLGASLGVTAVSVTGESDISSQAKALDYDNFDIIVCTLGRLSAYADSKLSFSIFSNSDLNPIDLSHIKTLVVDEVDYIMGIQQLHQFKKVFTKISPKFNEQAQTIFVSSTITKFVIDNIKRMLKDKQVETLDLNPELKMPRFIKHVAYTISERRKFSLLEYIRRRSGKVSMKNKKIIVFVRTIQKAERMVENLKSKGHTTFFLHSELSKTDRINTLNDFNKFPDGIMVSTDFASRGIDFKDVYGVINYDTPYTPADYIHRAGRAGRSLAEGYVITFVAKSPQSIKFRDTRVGTRDELKYIENINSFLMKGPNLKIEFRKIPGKFSDNEEENQFSSESSQDFSRSQSNSSSRISDRKVRSNIQSSRYEKTNKQESNPNNDTPSNITFKNQKVQKFSRSNNVPLTYEKIINEYQRSFISSSKDS